MGKAQGSLHGTIPNFRIPLELSESYLDFEEFNYVEESIRRLSGGKLVSQVKISFCISYLRAESLLRGGT